MFLSKLRILRSHGVQYIKRLDGVTLPETFRGRVEVRGRVKDAEARKIAAICPTGAIGTGPLSVDMGRCIFCRECAAAYPKNIRFTNDHRMATNMRENLVVTEKSLETVEFDHDAVRRDIYRKFGRALKLRQVCSGGDGSTELELGASMNVNFDFSRYGIEFVASPRHADGVVITGPMTENMNEALHLCYEAIPHPKIIILAGTDAISGGLFAGSRAIDRSFLDINTPDLYVPGNPVHPLTFIDGVRKLVRRPR